MEVSFTIYSQAWKIILGTWKLCKYEMRMSALNQMNNFE